MKTMISTEVIQRLKKQDIRAFDELYSATIKDVYHTVYILASNKQEVDDIVSEIYYQVWKSIHNYNESLPFPHWLNGLVFRQVKNWKRKAWKRMQLFRKKMILETEQFDSIDDDLLKDENKQLLLSLLENMSYKLKEVLVLYYFYEYSQKDIASVLDIPIGTVKSRHHLALKHLRKLFNDFDKGGISVC
ncbi:sigma-70 family RNA polymerase sigma factor [Hazenella sp. IB182353]|uniref:sigma-70 family RNA polymerase sigma factor n=1 Tax=Polycladospora coralii TaxID=2771432 RepID=UPI00174692E5|nr:sigma-70 family RNA polymerase sigma factor [Polycladospora coralii]MBS7530882.1 sigma-70 family RNA polymerase sigma factor [Polycladospora coralii]